MGKNEKEKKHIFKKIISFIHKTKLLNIFNFILTISLLIVTKKLNVLPLKIFVIVFIAKFVLDIVALILNIIKKKACNIIGYILTFILMIVSIIGIYYVSVTDNFLDENFGKTKVVYTSKYDVVVSKNSNLTFNEIEGKKLGYYKDTANLDKVLKKLNKNTENVIYEDLVDMFNALDQDINYILISDELFEMLFTTNNGFNKDNYIIVYSFDIEVEEDTTELTNEIVTTLEEDKIVINPNNINIYITGTDFTGQLYDFNMIVSINPDNKKVLLTSIPRDYHIEVAGKNGRKDNLNYIGVWGINTTMASLQNLLNIKFDYYLKVNTNSLVGIVDKLGGITYCSAFEYDTTHDLVIDTYNDTGKNKLHVTKGCRRYNGVETLTIARERYAFPSGDRQRQKNCQDIIMAIFKEMTSVNNIINFESILNSLSDLYTTSIPKDVITSYAKDILGNSSKWQIDKQSLNGYDSRGYVHLTNLKDYVMNPAEESVRTISRAIRGL